MYVLVFDLCYTSLRVISCTYCAIDDGGFKADGKELYDERQASGVQATASGLEFRTKDNSILEDIPPCLQGITREEMEMVFLGTGSSQPSKYRNVSAIYVHLFERGGVMLDCGEGTYAQLKRRYCSAPPVSFAHSRLLFQVTCIKFNSGPAIASN